MENYSSNTYDLYKDIQTRTGGELYLGVVGPVRTGKSTFIKRFMDVCVLPYMTREYEKKQAMDELPQSSGGKTITTTEPKFIPKEAAEIVLDHDVKVAVKLIDCVGFMVEGASGHLENEKERMVKTPWFDYEIPFTQAAEIGTRKVITDHASIGIVVTTDGSFSELRREDYIEPEERTINELKQLNKPFIVLVNSERPYSEEAKKTAEEISEKFGVTAVPMNLEQLKKEDVTAILEKVLYEFPISGMEFFLPKWVEMLGDDHKVKVDLVNKLKEKLEQYTYMRDLIQNPFTLDSEFVERIKVDNIDMSSGRIKIYLDVDEAYYYEMLSELLGDTVTSEYQLIGMLQEMAAMRKEYTKVLNAMESVRYKGYGVVTPERSEIVLEKPEVIRHGNKFGVKIKAESPSVHLIRANIETEIAPIVGTQQQAEDLIRYISDADTTQDGIWDTNIFGKTVEQLVNDGISSKIAMIGEESQVKLQETMQKIVNDTNGGIICIII
ncbi:MAG: stage IV sporulation protein A [Lachnospiraceae bacterium]|nr:stage IV sporulation protein A [Lachnospiraceae bacterium]